MSLLLHCDANWRAFLLTLNNTVALSAAAFAVAFCSLGVKPADFQLWQPGVVNSPALSSPIFILLQGCHALAQL